MESKVQNKQNRNIVMDTVNKLRIARQERVGWMGKRGEWSKKYKLVV